MTLSTLYAVIGADGNKLSGSDGIASQKSATGEYTIFFGRTFKSLPAMVCTQCNNVGVDVDLCTIQATVAVLKLDSAIVVTGQSNHNVRLDEGFSFIVNGDQ